MFSSRVLEHNHKTVRLITLSVLVAIVVSLSLFNLVSAFYPYGFVTQKSIGTDTTAFLRIGFVNNNNLLISFAEEGVSIPEVTTQPSTSLTMDKDGITGGVFNGTLIDMGGEASCNVWFKYGLTNAYGSETAHVTVSESGGYTAAIPASLMPGETYHYQAAAENTAGTVYGADATMVYTMPTVTASAPTVTPGQYVLNGNLTNMGVASSTYVYFEYGPTIAYGFSSPPQSKSETGTFNATISEVHNTETIYYRVVAKNNPTITSAQSSLRASAKIDKFIGFKELMLLFPLLLGIFLLATGGFLMKSKLGYNNGDNVIGVASAFFAIIIGLILIGMVSGALGSILAY